jgi:uncharacterized membrane protein YjjP (DUF1212 family)
MSAPRSPQFHKRSLSDHNDFLDAKQRDSISKDDLNIMINTNDERNKPDEKSNKHGPNFIPYLKQQGQDNSPQNGPYISNFQKNLHRNSSRNETFRNSPLPNNTHDYPSNISQYNSPSSEMMDQTNIGFENVDDDISNKEVFQNNQNDDHQNNPQNDPQDDQNNQNINDMNNISPECTPSVRSQNPQLGSHYGTIHSEVEIQLPEEVLDRIQPHEMSQFLFWSQRIEKRVQNSKHHKIKQNLLVNLVNTLAASGANTHRIEFLVGKVSRALQTRCQVMLLPNVWIMTFINSGKSVNPETSHTLASRLTTGLDIYRCELVESFVGEILRLAAIEKIKRQELKLKREKRRERRKLEQTLARLNEQVFNGQGGSIDGDDSNGIVPTENQIQRTWWGNVYDTITGLPKGWNDAQKETDDKLFALGFNKATNKFGPTNSFKEKRRIQMKTIHTNQSLHDDHIENGLYPNTVNAIQQPHRDLQGHNLDHLFEPLPLSNKAGLGNKPTHSNQNQVIFEPPPINPPMINQITSPMSDDYVHIDILPAGGPAKPISLLNHHSTLSQFQHQDLHTRNQPRGQYTPQKPLTQLDKLPNNISINNNNNTHSLHQNSPFHPNPHPTSTHSNQRVMYNVNNVNSNNNNMFNTQDDQQIIYKSWLLDSNNPRSSSPRDETQNDPQVTGPYPPPPPPPSLSPRSSETQPVKSTQIRPPNDRNTNNSTGNDVGSQFKGDDNANLSQIPSVETFNTAKLSVHNTNSPTLTPVDPNYSHGNLEKDIMLETLDSLATDALKAISQIRFSEYSAANGSKPISPTIPNLNLPSSSSAVPSPTTAQKLSSLQLTSLVNPHTNSIDPTTLDPSFFLPDSQQQNNDLQNNPQSKNSHTTHTTHTTQTTQITQTTQTTSNNPSFFLPDLNPQAFQPSDYNSGLFTQSQGPIAPQSAAERATADRIPSVFTQRGTIERTLSTITNTNITGTSPSQFQIQTGHNRIKSQQINKLNYDQSDSSDDSDDSDYTDGEDLDSGRDSDEEREMEIRKAIIAKKKQLFEQKSEQIQQNNAVIELSHTSLRPQNCFSNFGDKNMNNLHDQTLLSTNDPISPFPSPDAQTYQTFDNDTTPLLTQPQLSYDPSLTYDNSTTKQIGTFLNDFPEYPVEEHSAFMTASLANYHHAYTQKTKNELAELANLQVKPRHRDQMILDLSKPTFNIDINNPASLSVALSQISQEQSLYPLWAFLLALLMMGPSSAYSFFGGGQREVIASFFLSWIVVFFQGLSKRIARFASVQMFITPFLVSFFCRIIRAYWYPNLCMYPTILSSFLWILPGLSITNSVIEISAGSRVSGATRFITTLFSTLQMGFGMALGNGLVMWTSDDVKAPCIADVPQEWKIPAFLVVSIAMNIALAAHPRQWIGMTLSSAIALFGRAAIGAQFPASISLDLTTLSCAILVGIFSSLYSRLITSEQPITYILPGIVFLVPGSITLKGVFELFTNENGSGATSFFVTMLRITSAIAVGLQSARFFALDSHVKHAPIYKVLLNSIRRKFGWNHSNDDDHEIIVEELSRVEYSRKKRKSNKYSDNSINLSRFDPLSPNRNPTTGIQRRRVMDSSNIFASPRGDGHGGGQAPQLHQHPTTNSHFKTQQSTLPSNLPQTHPAPSDCNVCGTPNVVYRNSKGVMTPLPALSPMETDFSNQNTPASPQFHVAQSEKLYNKVPPTQDNPLMLQLYQNNTNLNTNYEQVGPKLHLDTVLSEGAEHADVNSKNDQPIGALSLETFIQNRLPLNIHIKALGSASSDKNDQVVSTTSVFSRPENNVNNGQVLPKQDDDVIDLVKMATCMKDLMSNQSKQELLINSQNDIITQLQAQVSLLQARNCQNPQNNNNDNNSNKNIVKDQNNQQSNHNGSDCGNPEHNSSLSSKSTPHSHHRDVNYAISTKSSIKTQNSNQSRQNRQNKNNNSNNNNQQNQKTITFQLGSIVKAPKTSHSTLLTPTVTKIQNSGPLSARRGSQPVSVHPVLSFTPSLHDSLSREINHANSNSNTNTNNSVHNNTHSHHTVNPTISNERGENGPIIRHSNYENTLTQVQNFQNTIRMNKALVGQVDENDDCDDDDPEVSDDNGDMVPM